MEKYEPTDHIKKIISDYKITDENLIIDLNELSRQSYILGASDRLEIENLKIK